MIICCFLAKLPQCVFPTCGTASFCGSLHAIHVIAFKQFFSSHKKMRVQLLLLRNGGSLRLIFLLWSVARFRTIVFRSILPILGPVKAFSRHMARIAGCSPGIVHSNAFRRNSREVSSCQIAWEEIGSFQLFPREKMRVS